MIHLATMGKFTGAPTKKMSAKYGGGTSAGIQYIDKHKFPNIYIQKVTSDSIDDINISIQDIKES